MPRIRSLKPEHRQHRKVGKLSDREYRLWVGMICEADDEGRLVADAEQLRALIFGFQADVTATDVEATLTALARSPRRLVFLYAAGGVRYASFPSWKDHQRIARPAPSKLPPPPLRQLSTASGRVSSARKKSSIPNAVRRAVATRFGAVVAVPCPVSCHWCGASGVLMWYTANGWVHVSSLEFDHLIPEGLGGQTTADNIVLSCRACNRKRRDSPTGPHGVPGGHHGRPVARLGGSEGSGREGIGEDRRGGECEGRGEPAVVDNPPGPRPNPGSSRSAVALDSNTLEASTSPGDAPDGSEPDPRRHGLTPEADRARLEAMTAQLARDKALVQRPRAKDPAP